MTKQIIALFTLSFILLSSSAQNVQKPLIKGMKITKSVTIKKGVYLINASIGNDESIIIIEGNNIIVDFNNITLQGGNGLFGKKKFDPDAFTGIGILIRNGKNITIKNLNIRGYRSGLVARNVEHLTIDNSDLSYNYREHLPTVKSATNKFAGYEDNDNNQWFTNGAGIFLEHCDSATVSNCIITGGQNALLMVMCNNGKIYNNDFSYNSGIGIGMFECNSNQVLFNNVSFNVRGYDDDIYYGDKHYAGLAIFGASRYNVVYKNAITHNGDGCIIGPEQQQTNTMNGIGYNVIMNNDFSYSAGHGIRVTSSHDVISQNRIFQCEDGINGKGNYGSNFSGNKFRDNKVDISIGNGQQNKITYNIFYDSKEAIKLYASDDMRVSSDRLSTGYAIAYNNFNKCATVFNITKSSQLNIFENIYGHHNELFRVDSTVTDLDTTLHVELQEQLSVDTAIDIPEAPLPKDPFVGLGKLAGRKNIIMTEWGPYDFRYPMIQANKVNPDSVQVSFRVLGPTAGKWRIKSIKGLKNISPSAGTFPMEIKATRTGGEAQNGFFIQLEYLGPTFITPLGEKYLANKAYIFQTFGDSK